MRCWTFPAVPLIPALLLSACNSTLEPPAPVPIVDKLTALNSDTTNGGSPSPLAQPAAQPVALTLSPAPGTLDAQAAALSQGARVQLAPIVGATVEAIAPLTRSLSERGAQRGIVLVAAGDPAATYLMKGYFSAISDDGETTVIYVWDVLDPAGNRLHRIQGQEKTAGGTGEGWQGVPGATMAAVGEKTIDQLAAWAAARAE
jgi:hypothetical protein